MSIDFFRRESAEADDFYRWIAPIYDPFVGTFLRHVRLAVLGIAASYGCRRILDIACGTGEQVRMLAEKGFEATGIDLSAAMLSRARAGANPRASYFLGNAENLPFNEGSFDCVHISLALHEMEYISAIRVVENAMDILCAGGKLILFDYLDGQDLTSRMSLGLLHAIERFAGRRHYKNFKNFVHLGGLHSFIGRFPLRVVSTRLYYGGATGLIVAERS